jgi:hypothetical protein
VDFTLEPETQGLDAFSSARAVLSSAKIAFTHTSSGSNGSNGDHSGNSDGVRPPPSPISAAPKTPAVRPPAYSDTALSPPSSSAPLSPSSYSSPISPPRQAPIPSITVPYTAPSSSSALNMDDFLSSFGTADNNSSSMRDPQSSNASSLRKVGTVPKGPSPGPVTPAPITGSFSGGTEGGTPARGAGPGMGMGMGVGGMGAAPTSMYNSNSQIPVPQASFITPQQYPQFPTQGVTQGGMGSFPPYQNSQTQGQISSMGPGSPSVGGQGGGMGMAMGMSGGYQQPNNLYQQQNTVCQQQNNLYQQQNPGFQQQIPSYQQPMQFSPPQNVLPFNATFGMNTNMNINNNNNNSSNNSNMSSINNAKDDDPFGFLQ